MNKFVKGAKNLAFALSFVTVAACGNVKKADLEAGLEALEKKMNDKFDGRAGSGEVNENQGYVRKSDLSGFVKSEDLNNKIADLKKEVVGLDVLREASSENPVDYVKVFGYKNLGKECFKNFKISMSDWGAKGVCKFEVVKDEVALISKESDARCFTSGDMDVLKICISNGAVVNLSGSNDVFSQEGSGGVKFGSAGVFDLEDENQLVSLIVLLELGLEAKKGFKEIGLDKWSVTSSGIGGKKLLKKNVEVNKKLVNVLNRYSTGCCSCNEEGVVTFMGNKGWTSDGSNSKVVSDVIVDAIV